MEHSLFLNMYLYIQEHAQCALTPTYEPPGGGHDWRHGIYSQGRLMENSNLSPLYHISLHQIAWLQVSVSSLLVSLMFGVFGYFSDSILGKKQRLG